jgi:hypothetical protein
LQWQTDLPLVRRWVNEAKHMQVHTLRNARQRTLAIAMLALLAACARRESDQMAWATAALARNPQLEVLASDAEKGVITVRARDSGEVRALHLEEIAAAPLSQLSATAPATELSTTVSEAKQTPPVEPDIANLPAAPAIETPSPAATPQTVELTPATPAASAPVKEPADYKVERSNGRTRVTGPGVSIVSEKTASPSEASTSDAASTRGLPVICEGQRSMHIDNRTINVEGDAITASGGCELYITNSKLTATGAGINVQDAIVHIDNSIVKGAQASVDAEGAARLYARNTQFEGLSRRSDQATISDLGGNRWK